MTLGRRVGAVGEDPPACLADLLAAADGIVSDEKAREGVVARSVKPRG